LYGQLGDGTKEDKHSPARIGTGTDWQAVAAGHAHAVAMTSSGSLWAWGANWDGQLGDETTEDKHSPARIGTGTDWQAVVAGLYHTVAMQNDGTLWAWGDNDYGQLGDGTTIERHTPVRVIFLSNSDTDNDGIDDGWEMTYFHNLTTANAASDSDKDGYSDKQEYLNSLAGYNDPNGTGYDPTTKNVPGGTGYQTPAKGSALPSIYKLLLKR
jgi:hypothetical protein